MLMGIRIVKKVRVKSNKCMKKMRFQTGKYMTKSINYLRPTECSLEDKRIKCLSYTTHI